MQDRNVKSYNFVSPCQHKVKAVNHPLQGDVQGEWSDAGRHLQQAFAAAVAATMSMITLTF